MSTLQIDTTKIVDSCINGQEAVDKIVDAYDSEIRYALIFMDFSMPILDGIDATRAIKKFF